MPETAAVTSKESPAPPPRANLRDRIAARIRSALQRSIRTLELRPARGVGTARTRVALSDGLTCEVEDGPWRLAIDLPERWGGKNCGPNPGVLGRAALGSCLAMAYARWAAEAALPIDRLEVEIQADYDARGELGLADVTPAYTAVRAVVEVESDADPEEILRVFARAEERCAYLKVWEDAIEVRRGVSISPRKEA